MALGEFDLIERFFKRRAFPPGASSAVALGIGDDCALLATRPGTQLAISSDMLVQGRHFFADVNPVHLGHKALAVNLSDLAACGAKPLAFSLALALPQADEVWLAGFSQGLFALADAHGCTLIGGETTQGPLNICITVFGEVPRVHGKSQALLRSGAQAGDDIYVSGTLGDARLALEVMQGKLSLGAEPGLSSAFFESTRLRLECPTPRIALGLALRGLASSAIDVSDGLLGDLTHILKASGCGACIETDTTIDLMAAYQHPQMANGLLNLSDDQRLQFILAGGDDYELLFTAASSSRAKVRSAANRCATPVTRIGQIQAAPGLRLINTKGQLPDSSYLSFDHFR